MKNIFVGNLNYQATEDEVRQLFEQYGAVDRVSLITDRETGRPRGFGFVEMPNDEEADQAIEQLNGLSHGGRNLNINEARPRGERPPRRSGGFGGGGDFGGGGGDFGGYGNDRGGGRGPRRGGRGGGEREPRW
ncbi:MAG: RNA-binding protein [Acidobacteria bacterium]|nr:RNA-binding protein [Acidobacteriota bacterium]